MIAARPDRPEWIRTDTYGRAGEQTVATVLRRMGLPASKMEDRCADLEIFGRIEVKRDGLAMRTGSVAVETTYRGRPSGIMVTCGTSWAFVVGDEIIFVATVQLREAVEWLPDIRAGEGATVRLLPLTELRRIGVSIEGDTR
jgi:hypothetical protein